MSHTAKRPELRRPRATLFVAIAISIGGCSFFGGEPAPEETKTPPPPVAQTAPVEELMGPPAPLRSPELEGPPEMVGPPAPLAVPTEAVKQPEEPVVQARATAADTALLAALTRMGADAHPSARGPVVVLPDTIFELGTSILERDAKRKVHDIGRLLSERAYSTRIAVEGHSDSTGAEMYNQGLSQRRASAVAAELVTAGVAQKFLTAKGFGSQFPIAPNARSDGSDDPQGRARNRRVEIVVQTALTPGG